MATSFFGLKSPDERNGWKEREGKRGRGGSAVSGKGKKSVMGQRERERFFKLSQNQLLWEGE